VTEILYGLRGAQRERVAALRENKRYFWLDVSLSETGLGDLAETLDIPQRASRALARLREADRPSRTFYTDGAHLVFATTCYIERSGAASRTLRMQPIDVQVLVSGEYLLTLHEERVPLTDRLDPEIAEGRSEQYVVYSVLDAMLATAFEALNEIEEMLDDRVATATDMRAGRVRMATLRVMLSGLAGIRRRTGPQRGLFERIGTEIERLPGLQADEEPYFDRLANETNRLLDSIDATGDGIATVIDLRLNEMSYWLTVVATIFLPLTFVTGFFGMNFEWMIGEVDTALAFWVLGVGTILAAALTAWRAVVRRSPVEDDDLEAGGPSRRLPEPPRSAGRDAAR
jgi:magnesium transporter